MGNDFRIGIAREPDARGFEFAPEFAEVLDYAVVHDRDLLGRVRMGVDFVGPAVRRPTRVSDADSPCERLFSESPLKVSQLALGAPAPKVPAFQGRDTGRVVAPVFEAPQRPDDPRHRRLAPDNPHDSAHARSSVSYAASVCRYLAPFAVSTAGTVCSIMYTSSQSDQLRI